MEDVKKLERLGDVELAKRLLANALADAGDGDILADR